ncbi:MAG TPA: ATP-binding cassette domain-containing protein [Mycobacterium sp.]|nr:ATP-binding cassette domain-containing protein [Mycobacterium sp.]
MTGPWGPVLGPVDLEIPGGGVTVLTGPAGSGRTALLMCLAGRMKPSSGTVTVFGQTRARDIFQVSALAGVEQLDSVFESVTVRDLITEQSRWDAAWYRLVGRAGEGELEAICRPVFGDLPLPRLTEYVEELDELNGLLLRIALANTARPPLLVVGSIDQVTSNAKREVLIGRLVALGEQQTVVTASVNDVPDGLGIREQIPVANLERAELSHQGHGRHEKGDD